VNRFDIALGKTPVIRTEEITGQDLYVCISQDGHCPDSCHSRPHYHKVICANETCPAGKIGGCTKIGVCRKGSYCREAEADVGRGHIFDCKRCASYEPL
jgi:hypothetical protein